MLTIHINVNIILLLSLLFNIINGDLLLTMGSVSLPSAPPSSHAHRPSDVNGKRIKVAGGKGV
jgi:hypothetical protein